MDARSTAVCVSLTIALSSGCMVGPNYKRPAVPAPSAYRGVYGGTGRHAGCGRQCRDVR